MGNENYLFLMHHGIKGMHWGVRRFQNKDGTLTALGKAHLNEKKTQERVDIVRSIREDPKQTERMRKALLSLDGGKEIEAHGLKTTDHYENFRELQTSVFNRMVEEMADSEESMSDGLARMIVDMMRSSVQEEQNERDLINKINAFSRKKAVNDTVKKLTNTDLSEKGVASVVAASFLSNQDLLDTILYSRNFGSRKNDDRYPVKDEYADALKKIDEAENQGIDAVKKIIVSDTWY